MRGRARKKSFPSPWWTRARVLSGLRRLYLDTGEMPTGQHVYHRLQLRLDEGRKGSLRRYPPTRSVLRYWPSFAAAWREVGFGANTAFRPRYEALTGLLALLWGARLVRNRLGERYGRLAVVGLVGFKPRGRKVRALWLCACDCGGVRVVDAGNLSSTRSCLTCAARVSRDALLPGGRPRHVGR